MFIAPSLAGGLAILTLPPLAGWMLSRRIARRRPEIRLANVLRRLPLIGVLAAVAIALPVILGVLAANARVALQLPHAVQYWGPSVAWIVFVGLLAGLNFFAAGLAFAEIHPERSKLLFAACLLTCAFGFAQFRYTWPLAPDLAVEKEPDGAILQSSDASCAPASAANVAQALGVETSERALAAVMHTTRMFGTNAPQIITGMEKIGIACRTEILGDDGPERIRTPAILFVDHYAVGPERHAIALLARKGDTFEIIDPLVGREFRGRARLVESWHGIAVSCERTGR